MNNLQTQINTYLEHCQDQKRLDTKTIKAYRIDLKQFHNHFSKLKIADITPDMLEEYISGLHQQYKPKTVKRKIASIKAANSGSSDHAFRYELIRFSGCN